MIERFRLPRDVMLAFTAGVRQNIFDASGDIDAS